MRAWHVALLTLTASGCIDEPRFESAYAYETDLCTPEAAPEFTARVDACRARWIADGSCAGVLSFVGTLDQVDGVASSRDLLRTTYDVTTTMSGLTLAHLQLEGVAPFFQYVIDVDDVGGLVDSGDVARTLDLGRTTGGLAPNLDDTKVTFTFTLLDGAASKAKQFRTGSLMITRQTSTEIAGSLDATNFAGDSLTGCFQAFVTETVGP